MPYCTKQFIQIPGSHSNTIPIYLESNGTCLVFRISRYVSPSFRPKLTSYKILVAWYTATNDLCRKKLGIEWVLMNDDETLQRVYVSSGVKEMDIKQYCHFIGLSDDIISHI